MDLTIRTTETLVLVRVDRGLCLRYSMKQTQNSRVLDSREKDSVAFQPSVRQDWKVLEDLGGFLRRGAEHHWTLRLEPQLSGTTPLLLKLREGRFAVGTRVWQRKGIL